jgi:hypothetical protein
MLKRQLDPILESLLAEELIANRDGKLWPIDVAVRVSAPVSRQGTDNKSTRFTGVK